MGQSNIVQFIVLREERGQRIDEFLALKVPELSKTKVRRLLDGGTVAVNGRRERFANRTLQPGDKVTYLLVKETLKSSKSLNFGKPEDHILWEDGELVIVNKPAGMPSQPTKDPNLIDVATFFTRGKKLWACHRLDKETSGILILAKTPQAAEEVMALFKARKVEKEYLAFSVGRSSRIEWIEKGYLSELSAQKGRVDVVKAGGRPSETRFEILGYSKGLSLIRCFPKTGRTHQIRVHLEKAGLALLGDKIYGLGISEIPEAFEKLAAIRHYLHAFRIKFPWRGEIIEFQAKLPAEMANVLKISGMSLTSA